MKLMQNVMEEEEEDEPRFFSWMYSTLYNVVRERCKKKSTLK